MRDTLRALRAIHLAPIRTAHAWFEGAGGASGGAATATPPAGAAAAGDPPAAASATPPTDPPAGGKDDSELHSLRTKAGRLEAELKRLQDAEKARTEADLSEVEKLKKQLAERDAAIEQAAAAARAGRLAGASLAAAARLGFADPDDAQRFLDPDRVEWSDDGAPKNVQQLLEAVLRAKPYLKASFTATPDLGQGNRGAGTTPLTRDAIAKMSPAEINARWAEVQEVMKRG